MGHSQGLLVSSSSLGLRPELPCSMTWCDSRKRERKEGARSRTEEFGSLLKWLSSTFQSACGSRTVGLHDTSPCSKPHLGSGLVEHALDEVVVELELGGDGVDHLALSPAHFLQPPHVVSVSGPVLAVARHLEVQFIDFDPQNHQ